MSKAAWKDLFVDDDRDRVIGRVVRGGIVQAVIVGSPRKIRRAFALDGYPVVVAIEGPKEAISHQPSATPLRVHRGGVSQKEEERNAND